jgi:hypothetical protein
MNIDLPELNFLRTSTQSFITVYEALKIFLVLDYPSAG